MSELGGNELNETTNKSDVSFDSDTQKKFDSLMEDDKINKQDAEGSTSLSNSEISEKYDNLFEQGDFFKNDVVETDDNGKEYRTEDGGYLPNNTYEIDGTVYETDDNGSIYSADGKYYPNDVFTLNGDVYETDDEGNVTKINGVDVANDCEKTEETEETVAKDDNGKEYMKNGELLPNNEYTINENNTYKTDEQSRITSYDSKPKYTTEGSRDLTEQKEIGGDERKSDDDGGHLVAKVLGGSEGKENLVPMRRTINRGDYKKMENEIAAACKENKDVSLHGDVEYNGDSQRPSMIRTEYQIDGKKTISQFDNKENSTELLDTLKEKISEQDYNNLCEEIKDMKSDGCDVSITSVKTEYDASGSETKVTVGMLDESTSEKTYKVYYPNKEV